MGSPWVVVWTSVVWIRHRFMVVRGFCFVKYGAGEIPAFAGMTWEGAGMTLEGVGMTLEGVGYDVDRVWE